MFKRFDPSETATFTIFLLLRVVKADVDSTVTTTSAGTPSTRSAIIAMFVRSIYRRG